MGELGIWWSNLKPETQTEFIKIFFDKVLLAAIVGFGASLFAIFLERYKNLSVRAAELDKITFPNILSLARDLESLYSDTLDFFAKHYQSDSEYDFVKKRQALDQNIHKIRAGILLHLPSKAAKEGELIRNALKLWEELIHTTPINDDWARMLAQCHVSAIVALRATMGR